MTYFIDSTDPGYRDYCAKIVQARARFSQEERNQIALEFCAKVLMPKKWRQGIISVALISCINGLGATSRRLRSCVSHTTVWMMSSRR